MSNAGNLPTQLREQGLFCCWRYEERDGKKTKVPYNPRTGGKAQSTNPATFTPLSVALRALERDGYDGIGVGVFGSLGAIDIDHCVSEAGELSPMAYDIIDTMQGYTEFSPSGKGLRILFTVPEGFQYNKARYYINNQKAGLEVYIAGATQKYVTVTGNALTPGLDLGERGEQLAAVLEKYMVRPKAKTPTPGAAPLDWGAEIGGSGAVDLDDLTLIQRAKRSKNGAQFAALWAGDTTGYKSASEADIALCNALAFWTNKDPARMDRLFRQSGLFRPEKWDRPTAGSTYGAITIQNAISTMTGPGYDPQAHFRRKAETITAPTIDGRLKLSDLHPEKNDRYGWNDIGNGNLFADWYKDLARYVPERKKWFVYNGKVWEPDPGNLRTMELCKRLADALVLYALGLPDGALRDDYRDFVERWQKRYNRETVLKDAASVYPVKLTDFDRDPFLFNCLNGTLDLRTREFRPHSPADMLTLISKASYNPNVKSPLWEKTVADAMQGNAEKIAYLQKALGYGLTGDTSEECFFMLYGPTTRNGKGTIMETYMALQGGYGKAARPETIAQKDKANSSAPTEDIARLAGARVVNISEPGKQMILSAALVKTLTGRDTIIARFLNENSFEFTPQFKLFINTNHRPKVTDPTIFDSGRVKVIPFERHFTEAEQDKGLKKKLRKAANLSGLLNWCLDGLWMLRETGLEPPPAVQAATADYQRDSDKIARFVSEMMEPDPMGEIRTEEAYQVYQNWCVRNGQHFEAMPAWKQRMEAHTIIKRKRPNGAGREATPQRFFVGVKWRCVPGCADFS
ncbi:phage/plasmid primase, P4 family [Oscillospiraceae bacterium 50-16]